MSIICAIPDVNGRPKHDNPFGKATEKDVMFPLNFIPDISIIKNSQVVNVARE